MSTEADAEVLYDIVLNAYNKLSKKGKPVAKEEWTHLAAVILEISDKNGKVEFNDVVALGTGTKCLGRSKLLPNGTLVRDSHAEVIARRCFLHLMVFYKNDDKSCEACTKYDIFEFADSSSSGKCRVKPNVSFTFFLTHPPCGDASIFDKNDDLADDVGENVIDGSAVKKQRLDTTNDMKGDIHRTGAKCVPEGGLQDPHLPLSAYHVLGALRSKPGRGDPTLSMSCSDKMLKWAVLGVQGALLSYFIVEPLRFSRLVFAKCEMDIGAVTRAMSIKRLATNSKTTDASQDVCCKVVKINRNFDFCRRNVLNLANTKARPTAASICFARILPTHGPAGHLVDVIVDGFKQGVTRKNYGLFKEASFISSAKLLHKFIVLCQALPQNISQSLLKDIQKPPSSVSYGNLKRAATGYAHKRDRFLSDFCKGWLLKPPELNDFHIKQENKS